MADLASLGAAALLRGYRRGDFTPVDAVKDVFARIKQHNKSLNAFIILDEKGALAQAKASAERWQKGKPKGPLDGVPTSIKEHVDVKGWPTRMSSPVWPDTPKKADAPLVKRLREAGVVILGKTATPEFCWKGVTDSSLHGVSYNPWDNTKTPGGSSGGAAAACAQGMGALHVGTDGGGSVRIPAAFCGVFGIKPTSYRVASEPAGATAMLSQAGPITRTVEDAALMLSVIGRPDVSDPYALPDTGEDFSRGLNDGVDGLRIGFWDGGGLTKIHRTVAANLRKSAKAFEDLGAIVEPVDLNVGDQLDTFLSFWQPVTAYYLENASEKALKQSDPMLVRSAQKGAQMSITRHYRAMAERAALAQRMARFHEKYDLLLAPMTPIPAFEAGHGIYGPNDKAYKRTWTPYSFPFNLTGQPAASVPNGFTKEGLPTSFQLVGPWRAEALILRAARAYESLNPIKTLA